jgi:hypothetical protein
MGFQFRRMALKRMVQKHDSHGVSPLHYGLKFSRLAHIFRLPAALHERGFTRAKAPSSQRPRPSNLYLFFKFYLGVRCVLCGRYSDPFGRGRARSFVVQSGVAF